ncbi:MAG: DUF2849 domain-containing protein [Rhodospirillaceae bacterium]|nr:DUF2849 domain-containing protein [Rhodospirillaceae bacterium]
MSKADTPKVLTGNLLRNGATVYYTGSGWSAHVAEAQVAATAAEAEELRKIGAAAYAANLVIDVNVVDVQPTAEHRPTHIREVIRATGPTVRPDLNKSMSPG